jgi:antitoxin CcdA
MTMLIESEDRPRVRTNITVPAALFDEAKALDVNLSRAAETGLVAAVAEARRAKWLAENAGAIEARNAWVAEHGMPLADLRRF